MFIDQVSLKVHQKDNQAVAETVGLRSDVNTINSKLRYFLSNTGSHDVVIPLDVINDNVVGSTNRVLLNNCGDQVAFYVQTVMELF